MNLKDIKTTATSVELTETDIKGGDWRRNSSKYRCTIAYKGNRTSFNLYMGCGIGRKPNKLDIIEAIALDAQAGNMTFENFCNTFGYEEFEKDTCKTYNACKKAHNKLSKLFTDDEIDIVRELSYH